MILKLNVFNNDNNTDISLIEKEIEINAVLADLNIPGSFPSYYEIGSILETKASSLPFIINSQNQVKWDVPYVSIPISDFMKTHEIEDNIIQIQWGKIQPLLKRDISEKLLYINISTLMGFTIVIHTIFKDLTKKSGTHPLYILDFILRKDTWDVKILSKYLSYDENRLIRLLEAIGYMKSPGPLHTIAQNKLHELKHKIKTTDLSLPIN